MSLLKTQSHDSDVYDFIDSFADSETKKQDSLALLTLMADASRCQATMWGPSMIGFGQYHYRYESGHEGDSFLVGFSPRKSAISLYVYNGTPEQKILLEKLGKFSMGKSCIYIKKLSDIDEQILVKLIGENIRYLQEKYPEI